MCDLSNHIAIAAVLLCGENFRHSVEFIFFCSGSRFPALDLANLIDDLPCFDAVGWKQWIASC